MFKVKFPTKHTFRIFPILRINGMVPFCNLFIERPSYIHYNSGDNCKQLKKVKGYTLLRAATSRGRVSFPRCFQLVRLVSALVVTAGAEIVQSERSVTDHQE